MSKLKISISNLPEHLKPVFAAECGKAGTYILVSKTLRKGYVGMSVDIGKRWLLHYQLLTEQNHNSSQVQAAYDKFGIEDFGFVVLEYVEANHGLLMHSESLWKIHHRGNLLNNPNDCDNDLTVPRAKVRTTKKNAKAEPAIEYKNGLVWSYLNEAGIRIYNFSVPS